MGRRIYNSTRIVTKNFILVTGIIPFFCVYNLNLIYNSFIFTLIVFVIQKSKEIFSENIVSNERIFTNINYYISWKIPNINLE